VRLHVIAETGCSGGTCPTAFLTDRGTAVVQGWVINDAETLHQLDLPMTESAVEIPISLLISAARQAEDA
jgi:hypothetical protein